MFLQFVKKHISLISRILLLCFDRGKTKRFVSSPKLQPAYGTIQPLIQLELGKTRWGS